MIYNWCVYETELIKYVSLSDQVFDICNTLPYCIQINVI